MRVASLLPSATEIVCAVGARDDLVGVSHECDYPADVAGLPILTRVREELPARSGDIDRAVREILVDALTVYSLELEHLEAVNPEVIVTQDLCDVCAVSVDDVKAGLNELSKGEVRLVSCSPTRVMDVWNDVRRVGEALGRVKQGEEAAAGLEARLAALGERTRKLSSTPSVLTVEWIDPVMVGGTWMPELVKAAGGRALVTEPGQHAPTLSLEELGELEPDVVLIKPCGFDLERSTEELETLTRTLPWQKWRAVEMGRVFLADGNAYFNRPGPRLVESAETLAACLHPRDCSDLVERHAEAVRRITPDAALERL